MNIEVADGLWQTGVAWLPEVLPEFDVILHAVPLPDAFWRLQTHPPTDLAPRIFVPFGDHNAPMNPVVFDALVGVTRAVADRRVLTVCSQGKNRSGLISALVLIARGYDIEDAIRTVQERASFPGTVRALSNPVFLRRLRGTATPTAAGR